jgi:hypothetical protein
MSGSKQYSDAALPFGYTSGCLVAFDGVTNAVPIAAEEMSIYLSLSGRRMVDDHTFFPQQVWRFRWLYHSSS